MSENTTMLEETARVIDVKDGMLLAETKSRSSVGQGPTLQHRLLRRVGPCPTK